MVQDAENSWQFDIFGFADATPGNTLAILTFHLVKRAGFSTDYQLDEVKLSRTLQAIEAGYRPENPYHNRCTLVAHPSYCMHPSTLGIIEMCASCIVHHGGVTHLY